MKLNERIAEYKEEIDKLTEIYNARQEKLDKVLKKKKEKEIDLDEMDQHQKAVEQLINILIKIFLS